MAAYGVPTVSSTDPGLDLPWYGIGLKGAVTRFFKKYATFTGRASRGEYWWVALFNVIVFVVLGILVGVFGYDQGDLSGFGILLTTLISLYCLACIIPGIALVWRRLHDAGLPGPLWLIILFPGLGAIALLILMILPTNPAPNKWGPVGQFPQVSFGVSPYAAPANPYSAQAYPAQPYASPTVPPAPYVTSASVYPPQPSAPSAPYPPQTLGGTYPPQPPAPGAPYPPYDPNGGLR